MTKQAPYLTTPAIHSVSSGGEMSGAGMDRKVVKTTRPWKTLGWVTLSLIVVAYIVYSQLFASSGKAIKVDSQRIAISPVTSGIFEDFIPIRARVVPAKTVYLDAIEGGRVERILVEDGAELKRGDLIVELSNSSLQLSVLGNEASVAEQLNNLRSIELSLEQNRLQHKRNLADINYQIKLLTRQLSREEELIKTGAVSQSTFADTADTLNWYKERQALTLESQASDKRLQESQMVFLKDTAVRLESNLEMLRHPLTASFQVSTLKLVKALIKVNDSGKSIRLTISNSQRLLMNFTLAVSISTSKRLMKRSNSAYPKSIRKSATVNSK
jgi:HlyD family secretion protein